MELGCCDIDHSQIHGVVSDQCVIDMVCELSFSIYKTQGGEELMLTDENPALSSMRIGTIKL